jgi:hypothetical protein
VHLVGGGRDIGDHDSLARAWLGVGVGVGVGVGLGLGLGVGLGVGLGSDILHAPPRLSLSSRVSFESRYGMCPPRLLLSASALMQLARASRERLMLAPGKQW